MKANKIKKECEALKTIRGRWRLRGWKFTPLERIDGVNETLESIDLLRDSPVCWSEFSRGHNIAALIEDLEDSYRDALRLWDEHRIVFDCQASQREFLRWSDGMFASGIYHDARSRYWELVTTSRFSVNAAPSVFDLQRVNWPSEKITMRHIVSLAAMVCIVEAIQSLEQIENWWREGSRPYRATKPFDWLVKNDPEKIELILSVMLETPKETDPYIWKIQEARVSLEQSNAWLSHLATMNFHQDEVKQRAKVTMAKKSEQARVSASALRKGVSLTPKVLADYFNARQSEKWEVLQVELAAIHNVSSSTVARRYKAAVKMNLLSQRRCDSDNG